MSLQITTIVKMVTSRPTIVAFVFEGILLVAGKEFIAMRVTMISYKH